MKYVRQTFREPFIDKAINLDDVNTFELKGKNKTTYYNIPLSFDIETTTIIETEHSYMYIWQFGYICENKQYVVKGRTWKEFDYFIRHLSRLVGNKCVIVWVHNLSFEFGFLRGLYKNDISELFCKEKDAPIKFRLLGNIEFRCSYSLTNMSLDKLSKDFTTTKKLVGDLDYNILRNSTTPLTDDEECYCDNDVIILCEFAIYVYSHLIIDGKIPLTSTGILRAEVKHNAYESKGRKQVSSYIRNNFPSKPLYDLMMNYAFIGGITHAKASICGDKLTNIESFDFTSSYPAVMLQPQYYYPERWIYTKEFNPDKLHMFLVEYSEFMTKTQHSLFSSSKAVKISNAIIDNGRIRYATTIRLLVLDIDMDWIERAYDYKSKKIIKMWESNKIRLPEYLTQPIINAYVEKAKKKRNKENYVNEKSKVNSAYGLTVQRLILNEIVYEDGMFHVKHINFADAIKNSILLPQWGCYVTAYARRNLINAILEFPDLICYYDTDSIKGYLNRTDVLDYIDKYNTKMSRENLKIAKHYNVDYDLISDLGQFDWETKDNPYEQFMTWGAKRYIYTQGGEFYQTIAGLGKNAMMNTYRSIDTCFAHFKPDMEIIETNKLRKVVNTDEHSDMVNGELMTSKSSVALIPVSFNMTVQGAFINLIKELKQNDIKREKRKI